jgi:hypothetical protein
MGFVTAVDEIRQLSTGVGLCQLSKRDQEANTPLQATAKSTPRLSATTFADIALRFITCISRSSVSTDMKALRSPDQLRVR